MPNKETLMQGFQIGPWTVMPDRGLLRSDDGEKHIEPLVMEVLLALAAHQGDVVTKDQLAAAAWGGRAVMDDPITRCISVLRKELGDNARDPAYIENIPRRGYRLIMPVVVAAEEQNSHDAPPGPPRRRYYSLFIVGVVVAAIGGFFVLHDRSPADDSIKSIAVFPLNCAEQDRILCYSFAEELISKLLAAKDLSNNVKVVRKRQPYSSEALRTSITGDAGVDGVFNGSLVRDGDAIHVNAEILHRRSGFTVWSKSYDGTLQEAVNIRSILADDVVAKLIGNNSRLLEADSRPLSFEALDAYTTGQYEFSIRSADSIRRAISSFEKTIELDPNFGPAHVRLAYAYALLPEYTTESQNLMYEKATIAADRGVAIDPSVSGPAQTVYGFIHHKRGQWTSAGNAHLKAVTASTVYPLSHQLYSRLLSSVGRLEAALVEAQRAREIDPQQAVLISRLAISYLWLDDLDNAEMYFARSDSRKEYEAPIHDLAYALFFIRKGDFAKAEEEAILGLKKYGLDASWVPPVFEGIQKPEKRDTARAIVAQLADSGYLSATVEITLWALLEDADRAMAVARRLEDSGEVFEAELMFAPQFTVLRQHPEFPDLLRATGLTEYWSSAGCVWKEGRVACVADSELQSLSGH